MTQDEIIEMARQIQKIVVLVKMVTAFGVMKPLGVLPNW